MRRRGGGANQASDQGFFFRFCGQMTARNLVVAAWSLCLVATSAAGNECSDYELVGAFNVSVGRNADGEVELLDVYGTESVRDGGCDPCSLVDPDNARGLCASAPHIRPRGHYNLPRAKLGEGSGVDRGGAQGARERGRGGVGSSIAKGARAPRF